MPSQPPPAKNAPTADAPVETQAPPIPELTVVIGDESRVVPLAHSAVLRKNAQLFDKDGWLGFKFRAKLSGRLIQPRNKSNPEMKPGTYAVVLNGETKLQVQVRADGSHIDRALLHVHGYDADGFLVSELSVPLNGAEPQSTALPKRAVTATIAVELTGEGAIGPIEVTLNPEAASFLPDLTLAAGEVIKADPAASRATELLIKVQNGFFEPAMEELEALFSDPFTPPRRRREAAMGLVNSLIARGDPSSLDRALYFLDFLTLEPQWMVPERLLLRVEVLLLQGKAAEARDVCLRFIHQFGAKTPVVLAMANAQDPSQRTQTVLTALNRQFNAMDAAPIGLIDGERPISLGNLTAAAPDVDDGPLVSVIVPVFNGEAVLDVCLNALRAQTWRNLEILVSDDASDDGTITVVERHIATDDRIRLIRGLRNGGPYVARNTALAQAKGDFVTTHDADDWSHPQKIELQVRQLLDRPELIGNFTTQLRVGDSFQLQRRGRRTFAGPCLSSFLFRREPVTQALGFWDPVRFGADAEFIARARNVFGMESVVSLSEAPLTIMHLGEENLTSSAFTRYNGFKMGARREYEDASRHWYEGRSNQRIEADPAARAFPVPAMMKPAYRKGEVDRYDVIIASDFRLSGGTNQSNIQEILIHKAMGLRTGLVQLDRYDVSMSRPISAKVRDVIDGDQASLITYGESAACDLLIVRHPPVLNVKNDLRPSIWAKEALIVVNEPPTRAKEGQTAQMYDPRRCEQVLSTFAVIDGPIRWAPIGPVVREAFEAVHPDFPLAQTWLNVLDFSSWPARTEPLPGFGTDARKPVIGRHSRDQYTKWPDTAQHLAQAYDSPGFETHVLGGADTAGEILGEVPADWTVHPFDGLPVPTFLAGLDFYVYFTHPQWDEAFGRTVLEALAMGVPVIAEKKLAKLFGEAAIYAEPHEVEAIVQSLWADPDAYMRRSRLGAQSVRARFSTEVHAERIARLLSVHGRAEAS